MSAGLGYSISADDPEVQRRLEQMRMAKSRAEGANPSTQRNPAATMWSNAMTIPIGIGMHALKQLQSLYEDPSRLVDQVPVAGTVKRGAELTGDVMAGRLDPRSPEGIERVASTAADVVTEGGSAQLKPGEVAFGSGRIKDDPSALLAKLREVYGKQQTARPFPQATREPTTTMLPERDINIEDLQGKVAVPWQGDRTAAGQRITGLDNQPFQEPVYQYGGPGFARAEAAQGPDKAAWASTPTATTTLHNRMNRVAAETGRDPVGTYVPGSPKSSDFSLQGWSLLDQMIKSGGHDVSKLQKLYEGLQMDPQFGVMPWAYGQKGTPRSTAFKKFDTVNRARDLGITPGDVRMLLTDPALLDAAQGEVGHMFALPDSRLIRDPVVKHPDYGSQIGGSYFGRFPKGSEVPREVFFADAYKNNPALGKMDPQAVEQTFKTQLPYQIIDQETVDRVRGFQEQKRKRGR